jgi:hypothetical protein
MFESIEIRKAANGFILAITNEQGETNEYVYDTARKAMRVLKQYLDPRGSVSIADD